MLTADPAASHPLAPCPAAVERLRIDLSRLVDVDRDRVLVAVSGGADSVALLLLAHALLDDRCVAATVDHGLRAASADEAAFVSRLCLDRGIDHVVLVGTLPDRAGGTRNLSSRARALRYALLAKRADAVGATAIATAHHADDQAETLLMRINRAAGVAGLAGIRRRQGRVVRPLLGWRRRDLAGIVARCGIVPVDDPSNGDARYDRARMRAAIAHADWLDIDRIAASAAAAADAEDALAWMVAHLVPRHLHPIEDGAMLDPRGLPDELVRRLTHCAIARVDPGCAPDGPALTRLIETLHGGRRAMVGAVLAEPAAAGDAAGRWRFRHAPPRRSC